MPKAGLTGIEAEIRRIQQASREMASAADQRAQKEALDMAVAVEAAWPVLTGATKISVRVEPSDRPGVYLVRVGGVPATRKAVRDGVKTQHLEAAKQTGGSKGEYDYPEGVEFGHKTPEGGHVPAHPVLFPTYRSRKPGIFRRLRADVGAVISKFNLGNR